MPIRNLCAALILCLAPLCHAQETHGAISGRVVDPGGAAVAGVPVIVTNSDTAATQRVVTNASGFYEANLLLPGNYEITVSAEGFKKMTRKGIVLRVASRLDVGITLELGAVTETVSITAQAPLLEADSGSSGKVIDAQILEDVPVLNNMSLLLAEFTPGVQSAGVNSWVSYHSGGGGLVYSINGGVGGNDFSIDGTANNSGRSAAYIPHTEAISEFKMETSGYDAWMGHSTGITVSMMTKSGTNQYHGSLTETYWNQQWQAAPFFVRQLYYTNINNARNKGDIALANKLASQPELPDGSENNYAATFGGPVVIPKLYNGRNRLFFFAAYNGFTDSRSEEPNTMNRTVPGLNERKGDFSQLLQVGPQYQVYDPLTVASNPSRPGQVVREPFPGNVIPQSRVINPIYTTYAGFYPAPNNVLAANQDPTYNYLASQMKWDMQYHSITNRADFNLTEKHRFFARWSWFDYKETRSDWAFEAVKGMTVNAQIRRDLGATLDWTYALNSTTVLDVAIGSSSRVGTFEPTEALALKPSDVGLPKYMDERAGTMHIVPSVGISGYNGIGVSYPSYDKLRLLTGKADLSHVRGNHSLRTGIDIRGHIRTNIGGGTTSGQFNFDNQFVRRDGDTFTPAASLGLSWASFMLGLPSSMSIAAPSSYATLNRYQGWYVQDKWRLAPNFTVNLGFRMEYELGPTERWNRAIGAFDPSLALPIAAAAQAAYAQSPIPELAPSAFVVQGGAYYPGVGGRDRKLWHNEFLVMPRASFAWQLRRDMVLRGGYGMFFDSNNSHNFGPDLTGSTRTTTTTDSTDYGRTWASGNPASGISPMSDPFPIRADGTRFDDPTGNVLGSMTKAGQGWAYMDYNLKHPRQQRGSLSLQKQLGSNHLIDIAYSGSYSDHLPINVPLQPLPSQYWAHGNARDNAVATAMNLAVTNPFNIGNFASLQATSPQIYRSMAGTGFFTGRTIGKNRLLRAFPQMNGLNVTTSAGETKTHAMIATYTHRFSKGFMIQTSYTRMYAKVRDYYYDEYDPAPSWRSTNNTRPQRYSLMGTWDLPFGRRRRLLKQGVAARLAGEWKLSGSYIYQPGPLLSWGGTLFYYGNLSDIARSDPTLPAWFNTANFNRLSANAANSFQARVFPNVIDGVRGDKTSQINANIQREFRLNERFRLLARLDVLNVLNRSQFDNPNTDPMNTNFGRVTAQTTAQNRFLQVQARLRF